MSRRSAAIRLTAGIIYIPLYIAVLFPVAFLVAVVGGAVEAVWHLATGRRVQTIPTVIDRVLTYVGGNLRWITTGRGDFAWRP